MKLHGTPLSHFTRKIRILLAELGVPFEMSWVPSLLEDEARGYADNPLLRVPALVDGDQLVIESDHIARYVVAKFDPGDRLGVRSDLARDLNRLAVVNGIMANEVVLILAKRGGLADVESVAYFRKLQSAMVGGLEWLDAAVDDDPRFDYRDIALVCLWQHLAHYKMVSLAPHTRIAARVARFEGRPSIAATTPEASLAAAKAAGWSPR